MKHSFKFATSLIKKYSRKSIFFEYLKKLFLLITLPFLILLTSIYYFHQRTVNTEIKYYTNKNFDSAVLSANNIFKEIVNDYSIYSKDTYVQIFLTTPPENHSRPSYNYSGNILEQIRRSTSASSVISSISIYAFENNYIISNAYSGYAESFTAYDWYNYYSETNKTSFIISSKNPITNQNTLTVTLGIHSDTELSGMIIFEIKSADTDNLLLGSLSKEYNKFYLIDEQSNVLYSSSSSDLSQYEKEFLSTCKHTGDEKLLKKNNCTYSIKPISSFENIYLLYVKDLNDLSETTSNIDNLFIICIFISLIVPLTISLYISANFYNSISKIITLLNVNDNKIDEINEFTFISNHIVDMIGRNKSIEEELVQRTAVFKKSQALALQTQLNPHFLFNTLHLIGLSARVLLKGKNSVTTAVSLLSELLATALDTQNYIVTVEQEINYAKKYIEIQQMRYQDSFDVIWEIDDNVLASNTVKLILQPLIENSFTHGISALGDKRGIIRISAAESDKKIVLSVSDNGEKIPDKRLAEIRTRLETEDLPEKNHIGLANVNMRLKLVYGNNAGITVTSDENGTTVSIHFPKEAPYEYIKA